MKLTTYIIEYEELQSYLDKFKNKIKFIFPLIQTSYWRNSLCIVVDEDQ